MRFDSVKEMKGEVCRRLTGIQRNTFEAMAAVLSDAKCKQKAAGGKPNTLSVTPGNNTPETRLPG